MKVLAIDTAAELCAACVFDAAAGVELGRSVRDIGKGHAEVLMPVIAEALSEAGTAYDGLGAVAVAVGPGSFTGVRIGVAAARGLALALGIPATGVTTLAAIAHEARRAYPGRAVLAVIDAKRDELYAALFDAEGSETAPPFITHAAEAAALARDADAVLAGSGAALVAAVPGAPPFAIAAETRTADISAYAACAIAAGFSGNKPKPVYLRGADARPQSGFALPRKGA
ncbi:tRNA (adenosine(37)-N6)-threonylcarbamoyltransferase complex dimerization subunit type 1 TsaB [Nitratireductor mangrovi]|uniref:tRNA (Adenosine(37)-N6)-threonylcarbamoyltransferase complex dimerization subunit type 1 TsaB n=1 Tax=Nitratireductor mangrovi TaxID=2599600 RepID=A0A5B8KXE5_9HYPH|nr:tRNA (adenosine(37)-N6)-threonylcarbamoyltransferase complex dimerization subunit type 1 TsaB [Nitratireductor mangrovi]QDZ00249.1 tRNA (adenosine(37)-N6)-threonylcarbamoyltransferase complex dimerization subunit type 1 TsaB [Nitratireductor mangrovi]